ncbi:MAG: DUF5411 family protein [Tenericutes bacterium]|nr:DUF5411 family protein [Mycoplasmatota bacterium]
MKWSFAIAGVVIAGLIGLAIIMLFQNITTNNEQDYYLLKEVAEAAMTESVDVAYYRTTGEIKISEQKFVENFIRRYAEVASFNANGYKIEFYDIMEVPPKASIRVTSKSDTYKITTDAQNFDIVNELNAILETVY